MKFRTLYKVTNLFLILLLSSCTLEDDVNPINSDVRDKFVGTWTLTESLISRSIGYQIQINYDLTNSAQVKITNFGNLGSTKIVTGLATSSRIVVGSQDVSGIIIEGTGTLITSNKMSWEYSVNGGGDLDHFEAVAIKQ